MNERKSGIELFRIISILLIVMGHTIGFGVFHNYRPESFNFNYHVLNNFIGVLPNVAVALFMLTTGTFIAKYNWSFRKIALLHGEISFYGWFILLISVLFFKDSVSILLTPENIANCITPVTSQANWFASTYVITMIFFPLIIRSLQYLHNKKKDYRNILIISAIIFLILSITRPTTYFVTDLLWMIFLIYVGDYLEQTKLENSKTAMANILIGIAISTGAGIMSSLFSTIDAIGIAPVEVIKYVFLNRYSPFSLLAAIYMIKGAKKLEFKSKLINKIASTSFAVYLIHEHTILKPILWNHILSLSNLSENNLLFFFIILISLIIFIICSLIDTVRICFIERPFTIFLNSKSKLNIAGYLDSIREESSTRQSI